jgi:hypothetical protein
VAAEKKAMEANDVGQRTELLGDFHVRMAELMGNEVLAQMLGDLISRCALITLMYQSASAAEHSHEEHADIVTALAAGDAEHAVQLMQLHLDHVEAGLTFDRDLPTNDCRWHFHPYPYDLRFHRLLPTRPDWLRPQHAPSRMARQSPRGRSVRAELRRRR